MQSTVLKIVLASNSSVKREAMTRYFKSVSVFKFHFKIPVPTTGSSIVEQPVNTGAKCSYQRVKLISDNSEPNTLYVGIENGLLTKPDDSMYAYDTTFVTMKFRGMVVTGQSSAKYEAKFPLAWLHDAQHQDRARGNFNDDGLSVTLAKSHIMPYLKEQGVLGYSDTNWSGYPEFGGFDRKDQIFDAIVDASSKLLQLFVRTTENFPKPGVAFQDVAQIMADSTLNQLMLALLVAKATHFGVSFTKIVGLDARGFIYGSQLASLLGCGFVMARKAGKQPHCDIKVMYGTEYSKDCVEFESSLLSEDDVVCVWDDLVATGGSLGAAKSALLQAGVKAENIHMFVNLHVAATFEVACRAVGQHIEVALP